MKSGRLWTGRLGAVLLVAGVTHVAAVVAAPYVMTGALSAMIEGRAGVNAFHHAARPTYEDQPVPMSSPDLVYSAGVFDVSRGPVRITAPLTGSYASFSLYAEDMENFFATDDERVKNGRFDLVLIAPGGRDPNLAGAQSVRAPSDSGIMVFRFFAGSDAALKEVEAVRKQVRCVPIAE